MLRKLIIITLLLSISYASSGCPGPESENNGGSTASQAGGQTGTEPDTMPINNLFLAAEEIFNKLPTGIIFAFRAINGLEEDNDLRDYMNVIYPDATWEYGVSDLMEPVGIDRDEFYSAEYSAELLSNRNFNYAEVYKFPEDFISFDTIEVDEDILTLSEVGDGFLWEAQEADENSYGFYQDYLIIGAADFVKDIIRCFGDDCPRQNLCEDDEMLLVWEMFNPGFLYVISTIGIGIDSEGVADTSGMGYTGEKPITVNGTFFEHVDEETVMQTIIYVFETEEEAEEAELTLVENEEERLENERMDRELINSRVEGSAVVLSILGSLNPSDDRDDDDIDDDNDREGGGIIIDKRRGDGRD